LDSLLKTTWTTPKIDDIGFPELPSLTVRFGGDVLWTTKEVQDVDVSDANKNGVTDYVEKNTGSLSLNNTFSDTVIDTNQTIRVDAALESSTKIINDDTSHVQLFVTQIDDLDTKKSYFSTDANWNTILEQYIHISGSSVLKDGHAVWVVEAKNNHRSRVYIESRIYSSTNVYIRSEKNIILVGPDVITATVLSSSSVSTSSQTIQAGDKNGLNLILGETNTPLSKVDIDIRDYITGKSYVTLKNIPVTQNRVQILASSLESIIKRT